jgi:DNA-binding SARP family transcriptional activator
MTQELHLEVLGGLHIGPENTADMRFVSTKAPALLCYLAVTGRPHFRASLAALLWSELPEAAARMNLRHVLSNLRRLLAPHLIITRETVAFDRSSPYWLDIEQFEAALHGAAPTDVEQLRAAVTLYKGDFLEDFYVREAPAFDEWAMAQRERLRQLVLNALHELVSYYTSRQEYAAGTTMPPA